MSAAAVSRGTSAQFNRRRPAYCSQFRPGPNGAARVCIGWPPVNPPAADVVALPPDIAAPAINWRALAGCHVFVQPAPGAMAARDELLALGAELAAAGVLSALLFDGSKVVAEYWKNAADRPRFLT